MLSPSTGVLTDAQMVKVGGVDEVFVFEDRIAALEFGDNVGAASVVHFCGVVYFGGDGHGEGSGFASFDGGEDVVGGMAGAFKELFRGGHVQEGGCT
jgi:hypothetical protein